MTISNTLSSSSEKPYVWAGDGSKHPKVTAYSGWFSASISNVPVGGVRKLPKGDLTGAGTSTAQLYAWAWRPGPIVKGKATCFSSGKDLPHRTRLAIGDGLMSEAGGGGSKCKTPATSYRAWCGSALIAWRNHLRGGVGEP